MSLWRICFVGAVLSNCVIAVVRPEFRSELVFDDFDNIYGDPAARNYTGVLKSYAFTGTTTKGNYGYWYVYSSGDGEVRNASGEPITDPSIATAFDSVQGLMHVRFTCPENGDTAAIISDILGEYTYADLSRMTALSIKVKGTGIIRVFFKSKKITQEYSTGHIGVEISLTDTFKTFIFTPVYLSPPEGSAPESDGITWSNCKREVTAFGIENFLDVDGNSEPADVYIDEIRFKGMMYADLFPTAVDRRIEIRSVDRSVVDFTNSESAAGPAFNLLGARQKNIAGPANIRVSATTSTSAGFYLVSASDAHGSREVRSLIVK